MTEPDLRFDGLASLSGVRFGDDLDTLRDRLRHVRFIGGGSGSGSVKSTIADRLAAEYGLRLHAVEPLSAYVERTTPDDAPLLHAFERLVYLQRRRADPDGRARIVQLTQRGRRATATIHDAAAEIERELAAELGADRLDALKRRLAELGDVASTWR